MRRYIWAVVALVGLALAAESALAQKPSGNRVEVLYFHGKQRCITCNAIERLTKEALAQNFASELKSGSVVLKVIDISKKENAALANRYEVSWSSLYVNRWAGGKEQVNNLTEFSFGNAKNSPEKFKSGVVAKVKELLR